MSKRELLATLNVYEKYENGNIKLLYKDVELNPDVYDYSTEDGVKICITLVSLKSNYIRRDGDKS